MIDVYVPEHGAASLLKYHLATHTAAKYPALTCGHRLDADWTTEDGPALVVFDDGGPVATGYGGPIITTRPTLRVVVWSNSRSLSGEIAAYALGQALSRPVEGIAQVLPGMGLLDARDSRNGGLMVSFTVRARLRATLVTEP